MLLVGDAAVVIFQSLKSQLKSVLLRESSLKVDLQKDRWFRGQTGQQDGHPSLRPFVPRLRSNAALSSWR